MINEEACLMPDIKACKRFMNGFDALFIRDQELWFGKYSTSVIADPNTITLCVSLGYFSTPKKDTLCFFDRCEHRWVMILSEHCRVSWQVNTEDDDIFLRMLASIAEDELKGSKGDRNDLSITNRIKNRYSAWFEERNLYRGRVCDRINSVYGLAPSTWENPTVKYTKYPVYKRPQPKLLQFNGDYTTVVWEDGSHTVVKRCADEKPDDEKAVLFAIVKHLCKDNGCEMDRYLNKFFEHGKIVHKEENQTERFKHCPNCGKKMEVEE